MINVQQIVKKSLTKEEKKLQEKFLNLCKRLFISYDKDLHFPFNQIEYGRDYIDIKNDPDYPILKEKMKNLLILINSNRNLIDADIEDVLWHMI